MAYTAPPFTKVVPISKVFAVKIQPPVYAAVPAMLNVSRLVDAAFRNVFLLISPKVLSTVVVILVVCEARVVIVLL